MKDVGPAILLTQPLIECEAVNECRAAGLAGVCGLEKPIRIEAGDEKGDALLCQSIYGGGRVVIITDRFVDQLISLAQEAAGRIVIVDRQLGAGKPIICGWNVDQRYPDSRRRLMQITDLDLERRIGQRGSARGDERARAGQKPEQIRPPMQSPDVSHL